MSTPIEDGGPAFPTEVRTIAGTKTIGKGMSLRDWFAGQALAGFVAANWEARTSDLATWSYETADVMLAQRKRGGAS